MAKLITIVVSITILSLFIRCNEVEIKRTYFDSGQVQTERSFRNGLIEGACKDFYKNGNIKLDVNIEGGKGFGTKYYIDGTILSKGEYIVAKHLGQQIITEFGLHKYFYSNGLLGASITYDTLKLHGSYKLFYDNGLEYLVGLYNNAKPDSVWKIYSIDNKLSKEILYEDGEIMKETEYFKMPDTLPNIQYLPNL